MAVSLVSSSATACAYAGGILGEFYMALTRRGVPCTTAHELTVLFARRIMSTDAEGDA